MEENTGHSRQSVERSALVVATLTSFIGPFMISSVNVALPAIERDFGLDAIQLSWVATSYLLAMAVALVPAGKLADIYGRRRLFAQGLFIYFLGTLATIFASSYLVLLVTRILQGIGGALFIATGMAILTSIFPPERRGRVIGIYVAAVYIGLSVGPFFGGMLVEHWGWRSIFFCMTPVTLGALLVTLRQLKGEWFGEQGQRFDLGGALLYGTAVLAMVYGATRILSVAGCLLLLGGLLLFALFFRHQLRTSFPVFEVRLLIENKTFAFSSLAALLNYSATFAVTFLLSLYLQYLKGMTPQAAGTLLMVQPLTMAVLSPFFGRLSDRNDPRYLATAGMTITVIGVALLTTLTSATSIGFIIADLFFLGTGFALFSSPNMSAIMGAVERHHYGVASGAVATMRLFGQMFSMATATVVLSVIVGNRQIVPATHDLFLQSIHIYYILSALFCSAGIYFSWFRGSAHTSGNS